MIVVVESEQKLIWMSIKGNERGNENRVHSKARPHKYIHGSFNSTMKCAY